MSTRTEHDYYGVPVWLMKEYLAQLGGRAVASATPPSDGAPSDGAVGAAAASEVVEGDGWRAELRPAPRRHIGSLSVGGATVVFTGAQPVLDELFAKLHWKTLRGGG